MKRLKARGIDPEKNDNTDRERRKRLKDTKKMLQEMNGDKDLMSLLHDLYLCGTDYYHGAGVVELLEARVSALEGLVKYLVHRVLEEE